MIYLSVLVGGGLISSLLIAWLVSFASPTFKKVFIAIFFAPVVTSMVASALIWSLLYFPKIGFFSKVSEFIGLGQQIFLQDPRTALLWIIVMEIWKETGIRVAILMAAIEQIPDSLYEAADIDGASEFKKLFRITIPLLKPQILFIIVIFSINAIRVFPQVYMMTQPPGGGPGNSTMVLNLMMYQQAFRLLKFGYGASVSVIIFLILFIFVFIEIRLITRRSTGIGEE
jgi:ABC-type sugar transport system permease subunit